MTEQRGEYKTRKQTIFRTIKNEDNPFVMIDRRSIENPQLSWKAKGILAYLLSRPDNWVVRLGDLVKRSPDGVYAVRGAINELKKAGHVYSKEIRDENGKFVQYELEVYELPFTSKPLIKNPQAGNPQADNPQADNPQADNPQADNLTINDTDINDTDINDITAQTKKIVDAANKKVDAILENERIVQEKLSSGVAWNGREKMPEPIRELLDVYVTITGQRPTKGALMDWLAAGQDWLDLGITRIDLEKAYQKAKGENGKGGFTVGRPGSLTNTANMFAGERRNNGNGGSSTNKYERFLAEIGAS